MKKGLLITTTNNVENAIIKEYYGIVSTNIVIGTNLFSDFAASFTDLLGGYSHTYQRKLKLIYDNALYELSQEAKAKGANAILSLKVDFDEIAGKGKGMFMISAIGTAVKIALITQEKNTEFSIDEIPEELLTNEITKNKIINDINNKRLPTSETWEYLQYNPIPEICDPLMDIYIDARKTDYTNPAIDLLIANFPKYVGALEKETAISLIYKKIDGGNQNALLPVIESNKLFDPIKILELINKGSIYLAIEILSYTKESYTNQDLSSMKIIIEKLENLPETGKIEIVKGLLSKGNEKYICANGHKNSVGTIFCNNCLINIQGLTQKHVAQIKRYKEKVNCLSKLFNKKQN